MWNMIFGIDPVNKFDITDVSVRVTDQEDSSVEQSMLLCEDLGLEVVFNSIEKRDLFISDLTDQLKGSPIKTVTSSQNRAAVLLDVINDQAPTREGRLATASEFLKQKYGFDAQKILLTKSERTINHQAVLGDFQSNPAFLNAYKKAETSSETVESTPQVTNNQSSGCRIC